VASHAPRASAAVRPQVVATGVVIAIGLRAKSFCATSGLSHGGDALLKRRHLCLQRGLVADARGHPPEQPGDLGPRLHETEHVVHQQQDVLRLRVAEMLGDGQRDERRAPARAGRLVHLAIDQHGAVEHARRAHLVQHLVAFAGALADASENRHAVIIGDHGADQLHHQHGLADACAAEHRRLAALGDGGQQVYRLDPRGEHTRPAAPRLQRRRCAADRVARNFGR
jgi:hypothetical protein